VYLLSTELFKIDAICLWWTAVHVLTLAVFIITVLATTGTARPIEMADSSAVHE
jgi:uncharacterized membrane protein